MCPNVEWSNYRMSFKNLTIRSINSSVTHKYHEISYRVYQNIIRLITMITSLVIPSRPTPCYHLNTGNLLDQITRQNSPFFYPYLVLKECHNNLNGCDNFYESH